MRMPTPPLSPEAFGARLVRVREARGLGSQREAAARLNVGVSRYGKWEKGHFPRAGELARLAAVMGVTVDWLLGGETAGLTREAWSLLHDAPAAPPPRRGRCPRLSARANPAPR